MVGAREVGARLLTFGKWVRDRIYIHTHVLSMRSIYIYARAAAAALVIQTQETS